MISEKRLFDYADLIVRRGLNIQPTQHLIIQGAPVEYPPIVEAVARAAYRAGAHLVTPLWSSDELLTTRLRNAPEDSFSAYPTWMAKGLLEAARRGDAFLTIISSDPELLRDEDPKHVSELIQSGSRNNRDYSALRMSFQFPWSVVVAPTPAWARRVFPDLGREEATDRLWEDVLAFCRMNDGDPLEAWRAHVSEIELRKRLMDEKQYRELRFEGPGTDLTVGLPERQVWNGGEVVTPAGTHVSPNMPTEEVFAMPHRERVEGHVKATRPIHYGGTIIRDLSLTFERGRIVEASASAGQEQLEAIIESDEGSHRLGEVALVSHDSPIAQTGRIYFNGLIDENAAAHLAIGRAYRDCIEGGAELSDAEFKEAGGNTSIMHVDFMVGSEELDVHGVRADGTVEAVLESGLWRL